MAQKSIINAIAIYDLHFDIHPRNEELVNFLRLDVVEIIVCRM